MVILTMTEPIEGVPSFAIGYAMPEDERGQGLATNPVTDAISELQDGLARNGITTLYVEAVVGRDNVASQKIAAATLTSTPAKGTDNVSGKPVFVYARQFAVD